MKELEKQKICLKKKYPFFKKQNNFLFFYE